MLINERKKSQSKNVKFFKSFNLFFFSFSKFEGLFSEKRPKHFEGMIIKKVLLLICKCEILN